jgi:hypothetical protein
MKKIDEEKMYDAIKSSYCRMDASIKYFGFSNGTTMSKIKKFIEGKNIDVSHFDIKKKTRVYEVVEKECPVCQTPFEVRKGQQREKQTCSVSCANTFFRSKENHGNWIDDRSEIANYREICFKHHEKECVVCGEKNIVAVHHYDENHDNNEPSNLIPLCPTHHQYVHSSFAHLVQDKIEKFRKSIQQAVG